MERWINNSLRPVRFIVGGEYCGTEYELFEFMYKPNQPVYYSFLKDSPYTPICNALSLESLITINYHILEKGSIKAKDKDFWLSATPQNNIHIFIQQYLFNDWKNEND